MSKTGQLFVLSAPSGCGKTSVLAELFKKDRSILRCVTYTTRPPRPDEKNGVDYHFLSKDEFEKRKNSGFFLEWAQVYGNFYGTSGDDVNRLLAGGKDVMLSVDVQGARTIRGKREAVLIFLVPPSIEELKRRLAKRGTETPEVVERRLREAEGEMKQVSLYDYTVVSDTVENCTQNVLNLVTIEREKRSKNYEHSH